MRTFNEFVEDKDREEIKLMVLNILDPKETLNYDSDSIKMMKLSDFENRNALLTSPNLMDKINGSPNRAGIIEAIRSDGTTVGNLLAMLTQE